jgi:probable rRNA maturation factor
MTRPARSVAGLEVAVVCGRRLDAVLGLGRWLAAHGPAGARGALTIKIVTDAEMGRLNRTFRGQAGPTDVLSFPAGEQDRTGPTKANGHNDLGDIAIARGVATRQARALGHPVGTELRILALHGLLHLLGYDHERDRGQMRAVEARLRRRAGLPAGLVERASPPRPIRTR